MSINGKIQIFSEVWEDGIEVDLFNPLVFPSKKCDIIPFSFRLVKKSDFIHSDWAFLFSNNRFISIVNSILIHSNLACLSISLSGSKRMSDDNSVDLILKPDFCIFNEDSISSDSKNEKKTPSIYQDIYVQYQQVSDGEDMETDNNLEDSIEFDDDGLGLGL